jgi:hypothetical protein
LISGDFFVSTKISSFIHEIFYAYDLISVDFFVSIKISFLLTFLHVSESPDLFVVKDRLYSGFVHFKFNGEKTGCCLERVYVASGSESWLDS